MGLIEEAMKVVRRDYVGDWCMERRVGPAARGRKRKHGEVDSIKNLAGSSAENTVTCKDVAADDVTKGKVFLQGEESVVRIMKAIEDEKLDGLRITIISPSSEDQNEPERDIMDLVSWDGLWYNAHPHPVLLTITDENSKKISNVSSEASLELTTKFHIPPLSTFLLSNCKESSKFRSALRFLSSTYSLPRHFNFILLDPPWPNASAKRKSSYSTASQLRDLKYLLLGMDIDTYIASSGYIGIWITNAPSIRKLVLGEGGLFEAWNVGLVEEWIWVKTTISGEPVTSLDGLWRKPYEVLLLGKAPGNRLEAVRNLEEEEVVHRVIFGVPDLHSRKPCLKEIIEGLRIIGKRGMVLEVFARCCIAGWWSWGNEVLKFAWDRCWDENEIKEEIELIGEMNAGSVLG